MNHYTYRAEWWRERDIYIARCLEFPLLSETATTMRDAIAAIERAVDEHIVEREEADLDLPPPITDREFSGTFLVRTSSNLHARLAVEAVEQGVSMNHLIVQKLSNRPPTLLDW